MDSGERGSCRNVNKMGKGESVYDIQVKHITHYRPSDRACVVTHDAFGSGQNSPSKRLCYTNLPKIIPRNKTEVTPFHAETVQRAFSSLLSSCFYLCDTIIDIFSWFSHCPCIVRHRFL